MGLFDLFKNKKATTAEDLFSKPENMLLLLWKGEDKLAAKIANLRAVNRPMDAQKCISDHLKAMWDLWQKDRFNGDYAKAMMRFAVRIDGERFAAEVAEQIIKDQTQGEPTIDLTSVWFHLGHIYHRLLDPEREYHAFNMATLASAPNGCKKPASRQLKAAAHQMAYGTGRGSDEAHSKHERMRGQLVPEVDWDDPFQMIEFMTEKLKTDL